MAGLDVCEKSRPLPGFDPRTFQPVSIPTELSQPVAGDRRVLQNVGTRVSNYSVSQSRRLYLDGACLIQHLL
jgi:hypothetical protein